MNWAWETRRSFLKWQRCEAESQRLVSHCSGDWKPNLREQAVVSHEAFLFRPLWRLLAVSSCDLASQMGRERGGQLSGTSAYKDTTPVLRVPSA